MNFNWKLCIVLIGNRFSFTVFSLWILLPQFLSDSPHSHKSTFCLSVCLPVCLSVSQFCVYLAFWWLSFCQSNPPFKYQHTGTIYISGLFRKMPVHLSRKQTSPWIICQQKCGCLYIGQLFPSLFRLSSPLRALRRENKIPQLNRSARNSIDFTSLTGSDVPVSRRSGSRSESISPS